MEIGNFLTFFGLLGYLIWKDRMPLLRIGFRKRQKTAFLFLSVNLFFLGLSILLHSQEKAIPLKLATPLAIGRTDLLFSSIASVCEDDQLNFYVLDRLEHKVFKFSPQGRLLLAFGQKGQGPGDFQSPAGIVLTSKGELAVLEDLSYISLFKTDGTFIRRLDLNGRLGLGYIGPDRFYGWIWRPDDQQQVMVDGRNKILKTFHAVARDRFSTTLPDETGRLVMFNYSHEAYVPRLLFAHSGELTAVGISDRYEIALLDESGGIVSTIRRPLKPQKINTREKDYLERELRDFAKAKGWSDHVSRELIKKIPKTKNQISAIRISRDYVFIFRFAMNKTDKSRSFFIDIFNRKGEFMGVAQLNDLPLFISERAMYFDRTDESGNVFLVRTEYSLPKFISVSSLGGAHLDSPSMPATRLLVPFPLFSAQFDIRRCPDLSFPTMG